MAPSIGVNIRVTGHCNQGGRKYMEDAFSVAYQQSHDELDLEFSYFGIFDGHGGREAALFAKQHLMNFIVGHKNFWSDKDENVLKAIKDGFLATHQAMWKQVGKWPQTVSGLPSTSGTTASVVFIRKGKMYVGHVGDSAIVLGYKDPDSLHYSAQSLTRDHKPESPAERKRIEDVGGCVMNKSGVQRVVWNRPRIGHKGPIRRSTHIDHIPFLAVARSLGDLWSYDYFHGQFIVSPEPDVSVVPIDLKRDRCIVLATDGVWNMVSAHDAVRVVEAAEYENERRFLIDETRPIGCKPWVNPSKLLVNRALEMWTMRRKRADNTTVVIVMLDPPGPPKSEVLLRRRMLQRLRPRDETAADPAVGGYSDTRSHLVMTRPLPPPVQIRRHLHNQEQQQPQPHYHADEAAVTSYLHQGALPAEYRPPLPPKTRHPVASGLPPPLTENVHHHHPESSQERHSLYPPPPPSHVYPDAGPDDAALRSSRTPPLPPEPPRAEEHPKPIPLLRTSRWIPPDVAEVVGPLPAAHLDPYFYVRGQRLPEPFPEAAEELLPLPVEEPPLPPLISHHRYRPMRLLQDLEREPAPLRTLPEPHRTLSDHHHHHHLLPARPDPREVVATDSPLLVAAAAHAKLSSSALKRKLPPGARELFKLVSKHSRLNLRGPTPSSLLSMCALAAEAGSRGPYATRSSKVRLLRKAPSL